MPQSAVLTPGVLKVATEFPYAPMEYYSSGTTPAGLDVDLMNAIAAKLGLKSQWINMDWNGLILALQSQRFDVIAASMGDYTDRQQKVTFVDYANIGEAALVRPSDAASVSSTDALAGKIVGTPKGSVLVPIVQKLSKQLVAKGLKPITELEYNSDALGLTALRSGRIFAYMDDLPPAAYAAKTNPTLFSLVLPNFTGGSLLGFGVRKDDMALAQSIKGALNELIADGTYAKILSTYSLSSGAIKQATINGGTTSSGS